MTTTQKTTDILVWISAVKPTNSIGRNMVWVKFSKNDEQMAYFFEGKEPRLYANETYTYEINEFGNLKMNVMEVFEARQLAFALNDPF